MTHSDGTSDVLRIKESSKKNNDQTEAQNVDQCFYFFMSFSPKVITGQQVHETSSCNAALALILHVMHVVKQRRIQLYKQQRNNNKKTSNNKQQTTLPQRQRQFIALITLAILTILDVLWNRSAQEFFIFILLFPLAPHTGE